MGLQVVYEFLPSCRYILVSQNLPSDPHIVSLVFLQKAETRLLNRKIMVFKRTVTCFREMDINLQSVNPQLCVPDPAIPRAMRAKMKSV